jgi:hypothetical protein
MICTGTIHVIAAQAMVEIGGNTSLMPKKKLASLLSEWLSEWGGVHVPCSACCSHVT